MSNLDRTLKLVHELIRPKTGTSRTGWLEVSGSGARTDLILSCGCNLRRASVPMHGGFTVHRSSKIAVTSRSSAFTLADCSNWQIIYSNGQTTCKSKHQTISKH